MNVLPIYHYQPSYFFITSLLLLNIVFQGLLWSHVEATSPLACNGSSIHMCTVNGNMLLNTASNVIRPYLALCGTKVCTDEVVAQ